MAPTTKEIPDEVAFSILSKLPLKSLKRFTRVRKSLALLFENPHFMSMFRSNFISMHSSYYDDTSLLLLQTTDAMHYYHYEMHLLSGERFENKVELDWPPLFQGQATNITILGSGIHGTLYLYQDHKRLGLLWNPATKEFMIIPHSPVEYLPYMEITIIPHGSGYDHARYDYKVFRYVFFHQYLTDFEGDDDDVPRSPDPFWEIYSLRSNSWRKLDVGMPIYSDGPIGCDMYMNGVCYWLSLKEEFGDETYMASFNLSTEIFYTTPLPLDMGDGWVQKRLVVLNGSIAVISVYTESSYFHISVLGEVGVMESWTKLFIVGPLPDVGPPIGVGKKGDIFFGKEDGELDLFDLSTQLIEEIGAKGQIKRHRIIIYKESLLPI